MVQIAIKRVYDPWDEADGYRVLVDRLWPRGLSKERAHYDLWAKSLAPSNQTRKAFAHKEANWGHFQASYRAELDANPQAAQFAQELAQGAHSKVTLLYGARDRKENQAVVLQAWLCGRLADKGSPAGNVSPASA